MTLLVWSSSHEDYLHELRKTCDELAAAHRESFRRLKHKQRYYRIPMIVLGTLSGTASFGTSTFPKVLQKYVSIGVGGISLLVAITQSIESYLKISERMSAHYTASQSFQKISEDIYLELSQQTIDRNTSGIVFVRQAYERFEKTYEVAPYIKSHEYLVIQTRRRSLSLGIQPPTMEIRVD